MPSLTNCNFFMLCFVDIPGTSALFWRKGEVGGGARQKGGAMLLGCNI